MEVQRRKGLSIHRHMGEGQRRGTKNLSIFRRLKNLEKASQKKKKGNLIKTPQKQEKGKTSLHEWEEPAPY